MSGVGSTRDKIITASNELFRRYGYNGTSLAQISEASGATTGSIYHFFPGGKVDLGVAVVNTTGSIYRELFEAIAGAAENPVNGVYDVFVGAAATLEETDFIDPCPIGTIAREVANVSDPLRRAAADAMNSWIDAVTAHLTAAGVDDDAARALGELSVSAIEGGFVLARSRRDASVLVRSGEQVTKLIRDAVDAAPLTQRSGT